MNDEKKTEIKVGITILIALLLFVFVYGWAKNFSFNSDNKALNIKFSTVAGLEIGDMVSVNGVRKGLVKSITSDSSYALVEVKFNEKVSLKADATFSIMMLDLMGGKKIEISSGSSEQTLDFNKKHLGKFSGDISTAMATLSSVESDLVDVIKELKISLKNANSIFGSSDFVNNVSGSISQLKLLTENLNKLVIDNRGVFEQTLVNANNLAERTNMILDENSNKITSVLINLNTTLNSSNELILKLSKLSDETTNSENNLGKLLYDEDLLNDLRTSLAQIKEMTTIINTQLKSGGLEVKADVDLF